MREISMFRSGVLCLVAIFCLKCVFSSDINSYEQAKSIYDFTAEDINGNEVSLEKYKGHVCIIVNVASECGLTDENYEELNHLFQRYGPSHGLEILAFPSNEFMNQEPGTNEDILNFAKYKGVKFDLFAKVKINGEDAHPLWKYLKHKQGGYLGSSIKWNFTKFIIDKNGQVVERFSPTTSPNDMVEYLIKYLEENTSSPEEKQEL